MRSLLFALLCFTSLSALGGYECEIQKEKKLLFKNYFKTIQKIKLKDNGSLLIDSLRVATIDTGEGFRDAYWLDAKASCVMGNCKVQGHVRSTYLEVLGNGTEVYRGYGARRHYLDIVGEEEQMFLLNSEDQMSKIKILCKKH